MNPADIVERLRAAIPYQGKSKLPFLCHEAADEIERLREQNKRLARGAALILDAEAEIERLRALQPEGKAEAVAVKPLEWDGGEDDDGSYMAKAHSLGFDYAIDDDGIALPPYTSRLNQFVIGRFETIADAQAAAQSDYETRIRSALQPSGQTRAEIIEECAKVVADHKLIRDANVAYFVAKAVRALAAQKKQPTGMWPDWGDRPDGFDGPGGAE